MISSVEDFKNRTLVESNTLKSFILTANGGFRAPQLDDILIHDYQIANSVTLNTILSNYIVDLKYAWMLYDGHGGNVGDSYFKIVHNLEEYDISRLPEQTKLILSVDDGEGTFLSRDMRFSVQSMKIDENTVKFVNLDTVWYGIVRNGNFDQITVVSDGMNDFFVNPNPFGENVNPFDSPLTFNGDSSHASSFNKFMELEEKRINCIVENQFYGNSIGSGEFGGALADCRYLVCLSDGFYGLKPVRGNGEFQGLKMYDIGYLMPNIDRDQYLSKKFNFKSCGFHSVDGVSTLFVILGQTDGDGTEHCHYLFVNEDSYDKVYGFTPIQSVVVDQLIAQPDDVFKKVDSIKSLDNITIALTDYGFWDIETNTTNDVTYSYTGEDNLKEYGTTSSSFNTRQEKLVLPDVQLNSDDKVTEYDRIWKKDGTMYRCYPTSGTDPLEKYWNAKIVSGNGGQDFVGGTQTFAVYDSNASGDPVNLLVGITGSQFNGLLFSTSELVSPFMKYLYDQVVHTESDHPYGEYYLHRNHSGFVQRLNELIQDHRFENLRYQVPNGSDLIGVRFSSIKSIAESLADSTLTSLQDYCGILKRVSTERDMNWLFHGKTETYLEEAIRDWFIKLPDGEYASQFDSFVDHVVTEFVKGDQLLGYFRRYLTEHLKNDLKDILKGFPKIDIDKTVAQQVVESVGKFIEGRVPTALVLGKYDVHATKPHGRLDGNYMYPGLDNYIYQNVVKLNKSDVYDIYSATNVLNQVEQAVKSTPFFSQCGTYGELMAAAGSSDLFKVNQNLQFVKLSNTITDANAINVNWSDVKSYLFPTSGGYMDDVHFLRAFIRTQIYRPLFFKANNYQTFTKNPGAYRCLTKKYYVNHEGLTKPLEFVDSETMDEVDEAASRLFPGPNSNYTISDVSYTKLTNDLGYNLNYDWIDVDNGKFVHDDVEFYTVMMDGAVNKVYFNEFQKQVRSAEDSVEIGADGTFTLNGMEFKIEDDGKRISVEKATTAFTSDTDDTKEFSQEIVGGRFKVMGLWYILEKDGNGRYVRAKFDKVDDSALKDIYIDPDSRDGRYDEWGITLQFSENWNRVKVIKLYQTRAIDRVDDEWCEFDSSPSPIIADKTYDWYLANEIARIMNTYGSQKSGLQNLGGGVLYSGGLNRIECRLGISNEIQGKYVVSKGVLTKTFPSGEVSTQDIGVLFDHKCEIPPDKVIQGKMVDNLVDTSIQQQTIILKNESDGKNNCNAVWMQNAQWSTCHSIQDAGMGTEDPDTKVVVVSLSPSIPNQPERMVLTPIYDEYGIEIESYQVNLSEDGLHDFVSQYIENKVHVLANGERYIVKIAPVYDEVQAKWTTDVTVQKLMFTETGVETMDFSTTNSFLNLREGLCGNLKTYMMNEIVQRVSTSTANSQTQIAIPYDRGSLFLDLFTDPVNLDRYVSAQNGSVQENSAQYRKFAEVFKNHINEIDTSEICLGNLYGHLNGKVAGVFQQDSSILLVDAPSILVNHVDTVDKFSYELLMDISLRIKRDVLNDADDGKCVVCGATIKDVKCKVTFTPKYDGGLAVDGPMKYDVLYEIEKLKYAVECDQVVYRHKKRTRTKFIEKLTTRLDLSTDIWMEKSGQPLAVELTKETLQSKLDDLFSDDDDVLKSLAVEVNNAIAGLSQLVTVEELSVKNKGDVDGIWNLKEPPPTGVQINRKSYGKTLIEGRVYAVNLDDTALVEVGGSSTLAIEQMQTHKEANPASPISFDAAANKKTVLVAVGETIVPYSDLMGFFTIGNLSDESGVRNMFMRFRNATLSNVPILNFETLNYNDARFVNKPDELTAPPPALVYVQNTVETENMFVGAGLSVNGSGNPDYDPFFRLEIDGWTPSTASTSRNFEFNGHSTYDDPDFDYDSGGTPDEEDNGWMGLTGSFIINFSGLDTETPTASISSTTACYSIDGRQGIVSPQLNNFRTTITKYTPLDVSIVDRDYEEGSPLVVKFKVNMKVETFDVFLKSDAAYLAGDHYFWKDGATYRLENVIQLTDLERNSVGGLNYAYMQYPMGISATTTKEQLDALTRRSIYIELDGNSVKTNSDGRYCPCVLTVLKPEDSFKNVGDIYDRYYETVQRTQYPISTVYASFFAENGMVIVDKANCLKTIRCECTNDGYLNLIGDGTTEDSSIPQEMRDEIKNLVIEQLKKDETYTVVALTQLQSFLQLVDYELRQSESNENWNRDDIRALCSFKYSATVKYGEHDETDNSKWNDADVGLFGYGRNGDTYKSCIDTFNEHLYNGFFKDFSTLSAKIGDQELNSRDYRHILLPDYTSVTSIEAEKQSILRLLFGNLNAPEIVDIISQVFGDIQDRVRYINAVPTTVAGRVKGMFVADGICNLFSQNGTAVQWHRFEVDETSLASMMGMKRVSNGTYTFDPTLQMKEFALKAAQSNDDDWIFRMANRDLSTTDNSHIQDAYLVKFQQTGTDLWYLSSIDSYLYTVSPEKMVDVAYEQNGSSTYVLFKDDDCLYRYDHMEDMADSQKRVLVKKENATMKLATKHSTYSTDRGKQYDFVYIDYGTGVSGGPENWTLRLYGGITNGGETTRDGEFWKGSPGSMSSNFRQYNSIVFGDTLFNEEQLRFQNISKNKDMMDILDVDEVDGCYYGLFKDESQYTKDKNLGYDTYTVFKTYPMKDSGTGVVQKLPFEVVVPNLYRTSDDLYSLFVLVQHRDSQDEPYRLRLQEISVPNSPVYEGRVIELQNEMQRNGIDVSGIKVHDLVLSKFKVDDPKTSFFILDNVDTGFQVVKYVNDFEQVSIDSLVSFKDALGQSLWETFVGKHVKNKHLGDGFFTDLTRKVNQFKDGFSVFDLIPAEFGMTQDVGVVPDSRIDDTDTAEDHRPDSVLVSTDILWTDGMVAQTDSNPGIVTAAVSNPATTYDDDSVFMKSQRNPSIEGTEFYDYIYDGNGTALMDLYAIPFIYRINSNNTYDLYINVPTTRTKYLNRIAGTLKEDGTSQVLPGDTRTRKNFLDEPMPNNLDESTTKLRVYIDRKYISVGNVELVEISGNSIPLQIYRDSESNNGLYDSIALESRWDGEVNEINEPSKDINKVMLEFECYGTDSQSIHIQGKTLINHALDDGKYKFG